MHSMNGCAEPLTSKQGKARLLLVCMRVVGAAMLCTLCCPAGNSLAAQGQLGSRQPSAASGRG